MEYTNLACNSDKWEVHVKMVLNHQVPQNAVTAHTDTQNYQLLKKDSAPWSWLFCLLVSQSVRQAVMGEQY
jgi:hypothetical protein